MAVLTAKEVAEIFNVHVSTVAYWRQKQGLEGIKPKRGWRRAGYRYTIAAIAAFAKKIEDAETLSQLDEWYAKNRQQAS